ncbi:GTP 3',8-cyclase MoaA [Persicobacter diffluens]|uniref:GTP 3',8-cyclase n=1 Tax=Persicobacter diffluens TaxID=981 RepID=A0AAN4W0J6_9BACT|nr:GTP 3',8-cyclase [Persicobacter diffluens]
MLIDKFNRPIKYLRLSVTDRCNLRCYYCMPEEGIKFLPQKQLLSYEEMLRLCQILVKEGVEKIRITGGEPFVRRELMVFLTALSKLNGLQKIALTTNGLLTMDYLEELKALGILDLNISLDSLDEERFFQITRRKGLDKVIKTINRAYEMGFRIKINAVVMGEKNQDDLLPLARLAKNRAIDVRFIEEMPFNGGDAHTASKVWNHHKILDFLHKEIPLQPSDFNSTAYRYEANGWKGKIGIIPAFSRTFCGSCDRLRMSAQGEVRTCLYANSGLSLRDLIRNGKTDTEIIQTLQTLIQQKAKNGFEAEKDLRSHDSMSVIGG